VRNAWSTEFLNDQRDALLGGVGLHSGKRYFLSRRDAA